MPNSLLDVSVTTPDPRSGALDDWTPRAFHFASYRVPSNSEPFASVPFIDVPYTGSPSGNARVVGCAV